jgi:hypothetical protein
MSSLGDSSTSPVTSSAQPPAVYESRVTENIAQAERGYSLCSCVRLAGLVAKAVPLQAVHTARAANRTALLLNQGTSRRRAPPPGSLGRRIDSCGWRGWVLDLPDLGRPLIKDRDLVKWALGLSYGHSTRPWTNRTSRSCSKQCY